MSEDRENDFNLVVRASAGKSQCKLLYCLI